MVTKKRAARPKVLVAKEQLEAIDELIHSLVVLDIDVSDFPRVKVPPRGGPIGGDAGICIIDITCCIIDCSCKIEDMCIYENPATQVEAFMFKLPDEADNPHAPVYLVPQMDGPSAFRMAHGNLRVPGDRVEGRLVGVAGSVLSPQALEQNRIAPTASVIGLKPAKQ